MFVVSMPTKVSWVALPPCTKISGFGSRGIEAATPSFGKDIVGTVEVGSAGPTVLPALVCAGVVGPFAHALSRQRKKSRTREKQWGIFRETLAAYISFFYLLADKNHFVEQTTILARLHSEPHRAAQEETSSIR